MSLKLKMLMLAVLPLLLVTAAITYVSSKQAHRLSEDEIKIFEQHLLALKKRELQHFVELAYTSIKHLESDAAINEQQAKADIKAILNALTFGEDGYFFVYDARGTNLVHPIQPDLVGKNLIDLQDRNGDFVIRNLLKLAEQGGGFHRYVWNKPSTNTLEEKLSYVVQLKRWSWMMGTGLYLDDIAKEVANARKKVQVNVRNTFLTVLFLVAATVIIVVVIGVAINLHEANLASTRLQELAHKSVRFQVNERRHFSRELHDGINQLMVSVLFRIELALKKLPSNDSEANEELTKGHKMLKDAINEVRKISHDLRPCLLDDLGLLPAMKSLLMEFSERTDIEVEMDFSLPLEERLPEDIEITFYRVMQEALSNIERHSSADKVEVKMWQQSGQVWLEVNDNGCGMELEKALQQDGIGLKNMRERVELLSGQFEIHTDANRGTRITVSLKPMFIGESST